MRFTGRPAYLLIADEIREQILSGALAAGAQLPSEADLMATHNVSRMVAKMAATTLRDEGLIDSHPGKGRFVRPARQLTRLARDRYGRNPGRMPPFASDAQSAGADAAWEQRSERGTASATIARRLQVGLGDPVMVTHYRFHADGRPIQISSSYEPLAITGGTPIEEPERGTVRGVIQRMDTIGRHVDAVTEEVTARAPRPHERAVLDVPAGIPVLVVARTHWSGETPLETCDIVISADRYALAYRIPVVDEQEQASLPHSPPPHREPPRRYAGAPRHESGPIHRAAPLERRSRPRSANAADGNVGHGPSRLCARWGSTQRG